MYHDLLKSYKNVTIECDKRLKNLFKKSFSEYKNSFVDFGSVSNNKNKLEKYEYTIYAGSLGKFFRNKIIQFGNFNNLKDEKN